MSDKAHLPEEFHTKRLIYLCSLANFINAADRVIMPIAILGLAHDYNYDITQQGLILSAFPFGYISSQIAGSCAGAQFGGRRLLLFVVFMWSLSTFITPLVAPALHMLIFSRIILGVGEGLGLPTIYHIFAQAIPSDQRSSAFSYLAAFGSIGQTLAALLCPHLYWWLPFYFFGALGLVWCALWLKYSEDFSGLPDHVLLCNQAPNMLHRLRSFFNNWAVWSIYIAHFSMNWTSYIVMIWLPTYLARSLHANPEHLSFASLPYLLNSLCSIGVGHLADSLISHHKMSLIRVRKLMTILGLVGPAVLLLWFSAISHIYSAVLLISITMGMLAFNSAGHLSNHADICPRYAGICFAISNTIATIPGVAAGPMTAWLVHESGGRWFPVFILASCLNLVGAVVYAGHASASHVIY